MTACEHVEKLIALANTCADLGDEVKLMHLPEWLYDQLMQEIRHRHLRYISRRNTDNVVPIRPTFLGVQLVRGL